MNKKYLCLLLLVLLFIPSVGYAQQANPFVVIITNSIDYNLGGIGLVNALEANGIDVSVMSANSFNKGYSDGNNIKIIILLGGHEAPDGVGAIVYGLLSATGRQFFSGAEGLMKMRDVWRESDQLVMIIAGPDRYATQRAVEQNHQKVIDLIKQEYIYSVYVGSRFTQEKVDKKYENE